MRYRQYGIIHETVERGDDLPLYFTSGAVFDLDSGVLVAIIDSRESGFCCGSDGWTGLAVYGDPFLLVCAE